MGQLNQSQDCEYTLGCIQVAMPSMPIDDLRRNFYQWIGTSPYSPTEGADYCLRLAMSGLRMPWESRAFVEITMNCTNTVSPDEFPRIAKLVADAIKAGERMPKHGRNAGQAHAHDYRQELLGASHD
jgi:hypothetical protein